MSHIAIVPARAGSKSITNKNLMKVGHTSLVDITINQAKASGLFSEIILSTDIEVLHDTYSEDEKITLHKRALGHATDESTPAEFVYWLIKDRDPEDYIWLLQPTSPFRRVTDFRVIKNQCSEFNSVISVNNVEDDHPNRMYTMPINTLFPLRFNNFRPKQDLKTVFIRNGAFYVAKVGPWLTAFKDNMMSCWFIKPCLGHKMDRNHSINIDNELDLLLARAMVDSGVVSV